MTTTSPMIYYAIGAVIVIAIVIVVAIVARAEHGRLACSDASAPR